MMVARLHMAMDEGHGMAPEKSLVSLKDKGLELPTEKVVLDGNKIAETPFPSRILGQRGASGGGGGPSAKKPEPEVSPAEPAPDLSREPFQKQPTPVQQIVENIVSPRTGKRLTHRYAEAISLKQAEGHRLNVTGTEELNKMGKDLG